MLFAIVSLVLSAILMTQADVISDVTNVEPLFETLFIYDVTSDAPVAELKGALESAGVEVRHSFQVIGAPRYFFAVVDDGSSEVSQLTFPEGSMVTQYPVEHASDYFTMVGSVGWNETDTLDYLEDKNLMVIIWDLIIPDGTSTSEFKMMMSAYGTAFRGPQEIVKPLSYTVIGRYPPKMYFFVNLDENALQNAILDGLDAAGGPGNNVVNVLRTRKI
ncbi:uncharacterized protein [Littorina saxatilis]|uniref:Uncharacterized protein n=1 Tax=Littorina saxatilis TaxID=31220 RepID=A0AAN9AQI3_9CAEN